MPPLLTSVDKLKVLHIEDDPAWVAYVAKLIEAWPEFQLAGSETTGAAGIERCQKGDLDVLLLDLRLPDMDGYTLLEKIAHRRRPPPTLLLSARRDAVALHKSRSRFVAGMILKSTNLDQMLRTALTTAAAGGTFYSPETQNAIRRSNAASDAYHKILTPREEEVVRLLAAGYSDSDVAAVLGISYATAHVHRQNMMNKLGIHSAVKLMAWARSKGFE